MVIGCQGPLEWHLSGLQLSHHLHTLLEEGIYKQCFPVIITPFIYCSSPILLWHHLFYSNSHARDPLTMMGRGKHRSAVRLLSPTRQKFQGNLILTRFDLGKISTGKLLLLLDRLTSSNLLIWLTLSVTFTEIPGNLIPTHSVRATCRRLTFLMFCNLIGWLFHISLSPALVI